MIHSEGDQCVVVVGGRITSSTNKQETSRIGYGNPWVGGVHSPLFSLDLPARSSMLASTISKPYNSAQISLQTAAAPVSNAAFSAASAVDFTAIRLALGMCAESHFCVCPSPWGWLYTLVILSNLLLESRHWCTVKYVSARTLTDVWIK